MKISITEFTNESVSSPKSRRNPMTKTINRLRPELSSGVINWKALKSNPHKYAESADIDTLILALEEMDSVYYNKGEPIVSDATYDAFRNAVRLHAPTHVYFNKVGSAVSARDKRKVRLPYYLPSLDKLHPNTPEAQRWYALNKRNWLVMDKLDGVSLLIVYEKNSFKAYTRGDGTTGQEVTDSIKNINSIPQVLPANSGHIAVRGELIMNRATFENTYKSNLNTPKQGAARFSNSRALIVGAVNRLGDSKTGKTERNPLEDAIFIAYELIHDNNQTTANYTPVQQLQKLKAYGFTVVQHRILDTADDTFLSGFLHARKERSKYDVDGLVVVRNTPYTRTNDDRPEYAKAFKDNATSEQKVVEVKDVIWSITRTGVLAPRVMIEPTHLSGSTITYLTGFNAFFIENGYSYKDRNNSEINKIPRPIGPGAKIRIVKSGDVIPYIMEVVKAAHKPKMPSSSYEYDDNHVTIISASRETVSSSDGHASEHSALERQKVVEMFLHFFRTIGALHVGESIVNKMLDTGNAKMAAFIKMPVRDFETKLGLSKLMATKIHNSIHDSLATASLSLIASGTGIFGRGIGERRLFDLFNNFPTILTTPIHNRLDAATLEDNIASLNGFSHNTAQQIVLNLPKFKAFIQAIGLTANHNIESIRNPPKLSSTKLNNIMVVFSKVRDKELENYIVDNGGSVANSVTNAVTHLIVSSLSDTSTKIEKAKEKGVVVITLAQFKAKFAH